MLADAFDGLSCRVIDAEGVETSTHREVLLVIAQTFDSAGVTILCEPSVVGAKSGRPDIAIVDPESGVHVVEVKGIELKQVLSQLLGGGLEIQYESSRSRKDPIKQASKAMFDIKDAASRHFGGELNAVFEHWVAFPRIRRSDWEAKFGDELSRRSEVLFADDLESSRLGDRMRSSARKRFEGRERVPELQVRSLMAAFGDSAALAVIDRPLDAPRAAEGSKGERLTDALGEHRALTEQQQRLASQSWADGPRLVRGVAGSGKTAVLATQVAKMVERRKSQPSDLFATGSRRERILVVCYNRTLVPFIHERIQLAYLQRTGAQLPSGFVVVQTINQFYSALDRLEMISFIGPKDVEDPGERARTYLTELKSKGVLVEEQRYHAVVVDEGQDLHEDEYRVLLEFTDRGADESPRMFVFYDDAQNLFDRKRPVWSALGLEVRGRTAVMEECFRNTRQIIEPAFNVLLGTHAANPNLVRMREYADVAGLRARGLVESHGRHYEVKFAARNGDVVRITRSRSAAHEADLVAARAAELLSSDGLMPHDLLILTWTRQRAEELARRIAWEVGESMVRLVSATSQKDSLAVQQGTIAVSTVNSVKGYDAPCVLMVSGNEFSDSKKGRATFYVGCTRAREWLEVSSWGESTLMSEFERAVAAMT